MTQEWIQLVRNVYHTTSHEDGVVAGALKCRRVVQARLHKDGSVGLYARVPLPKSVAASIGKPAVPAEGAR